MKRYRAEHPDQPVLYADAGRAFQFKSTEAEVVVPFLIEAFKALDLDVINAGDEEIEAGFVFFRGLMRDAGFPAVSANLVDIDTGQPVLPPYTVLTPKTGSGRAPGPKVALVGFSEPLKPRVVDAPDGRKIHFADPIRAAAKVLPEARREADIVVVIADFGIQPARRMAEHFPDIDLIIGHHPDFDNVVEATASGVPIITTGVLGKRLVRADFRRQAGPRRWDVRFDVTVLDHQVVDDPEAAVFMQRLQAGLNESTARRAELNRKDARYPDYVGAASCARCHPEAGEAWAASNHARAWVPVQESRNNANGLCLECHVTGFRKPNGFFSERTEPHLAAVGCESCHGPGGAHTADPKGQNLSLGDSGTCLACHTKGQSPGFDFAAFWARIAHGGSRKASKSQDGSPPLNHAGLRDTVSAAPFTGH